MGYRYIPQGAEEITREGVDAVVYYRKERGDIYGIAYGGKRSKPDFNYLFRTRERFDKYVKDYFDRIEAAAKYKEELKAKRKAAKAEFAKSLKVGDMLYSSWGYDQTNIDFYQIVGKSGQKLTIREIGATYVPEDRNDYQDKLVAKKDAFISEEFTKMAQDGYVKISSCQYAYPYNGEAKYQTASGYGH